MCIGTNMYAGATNQQVIEDLRRLKADLAKRYRLQRFFLFGSRARNEELLTSDVDLIVVSQDFADLKFRERPPVVLELWPDVVDLNALCYTPEEFERMKQLIGVVQDAAKDALDI